MSVSLPPDEVVGFENGPSVSSWRSEKQKEIPPGKQYP